MLEYFSVINYKNFKSKIEIDFTKVGGYKFNNECIIDNCIGKSIIYGRNSTGKTNLGNAIINIYKSLFLYFDETNIINADSEQNHADFCYRFKLGSDTVVYKYSIDEKNYVREEQLYINSDLIFKVDIKNSSYNELNLNKISSENIQVNNFFDNYDEEIGNDYSVSCFLRFLLNNVPFSNDSVIKRMARYISGMRFISVMVQLTSRRSSDIFESLNLNELEYFFEKMGMNYKFCVDKLTDNRTELFVKYKNGSLPFYNVASSGARSLLNLYCRIILSKSTFIYMDEFDAFYHYEMSENLIEFMKEKYPECQIVLTTHNTNLMSNRIMRPDCLFIISGEGKITALCDATERELREGHNLEKLYIAGEFEKYE